VNLASGVPRFKCVLFENKKLKDRAFLHHHFAMLAFGSVEPALSPMTLQVVDSFGFTNMTPVQAATIPLFLQHKDVCVEVRLPCSAPQPHASG